MLMKMATKLKIPIVGTAFRRCTTAHTLSFSPSLFLNVVFHSLDEYSYGRIPEPPTKGTSTAAPESPWGKEDAVGEGEEDTYDPHK